MPAEHEHGDTGVRPYRAREPHECKQRAEAFLGLGDVDVDVPRAIAWGLLAVAAELHIIRKGIRREATRSGKPRGG